MMHKAWSNIEEVPYHFSRSSIKFQGHTGQKIAYFDPNWAFPDCNFGLNSPMDLKWCTKLDIVWKRCPIIFRGHLSNFKVTQAEKSDLDQIWARLLGRAQLSNPSDLPCSRSYRTSIFKVTRDKKSPILTRIVFPDCNSSLNIPMALKCCTKLNIV